MITWESTKEQIFEMPTGGAAIMRKGPNLLKLARKEQCLALTTQLRNKFKVNPCFYRVYPTGEVQYLHPKDGVYPEKVNAGRPGVNQNFRRIGENVNPIKVRRQQHAGWVTATPGAQQQRRYGSNSSHSKSLQGCWDLQQQPQQAGGGCDCVDAVIRLRGCCDQGQECCCDVGRCA